MLWIKLETFLSNIYVYDSQTSIDLFYIKKRISIHLDCGQRQSEHYPLTGGHDKKKLMIPTDKPKSIKYAKEELNFI
jgi:hypothetical protein